MGNMAELNQSMSHETQASGRQIATEAGPMKLYYSETLHPRKACAIAKYLDFPVEYVPVDLSKGEHLTSAFRAINPNAKVPVLVHAGKTLWESNAIMCYLAAQAGSDLWPHDTRQFDVIRWLNWDASEFLPQAGAFYFEYIIKSRIGLGPPDPAVIEKATKGFHRYARVLDDHLGARRYLVGDGLTVADFAVAITLPYADEAHIPLDNYPAIRRWHARLNEHAAWRDPFPRPGDHEHK